MAKVALTNGRSVQDRRRGFRAAFLFFCIRKKTPNAERQTPNIELKEATKLSEFGVGCWALSVGRFL